MEKRKYEQLAQPKQMAGAKSEHKKHITPTKTLHIAYPQKTEKTTTTKHTGHSDTKDLARAQSFFKKYKHTELANTTQKGKKKHTGGESAK